MSKEFAALTPTRTAAEAISRGLQQGWSTADLLRIVRQMLAHSRYVTTADQRDNYFAQPPSTGDPRWDAMLAGCVEMTYLRSFTKPPVWTAGHALSEAWWVSSGESMKAYVFAHSPFSLHIRGIMVDPTDLEWV